MNDNIDTAPFRWRDIGTALTLLARFPIPLILQTPTRFDRVAWAYPLAGSVIGLLAGGILWLALAVGIPPSLSAAICLGTMAMLTGALHEDGFADCADGLGGGHTKERRLEIMKDSRIGAFGTVALVLNILTRWSALTALAAVMPVAAVVVVATAARLPMTVAMLLMPHARTNGLAARAGKPAPIQVLAAILCATVIGLIFVGWIGIWVVFAALLAAVPLGLMAQSKIGGMTGDVLGGIEQSAEIAVLILLAAIFT